jgi:hypothetical protein
VKNAGKSFRINPIYRVGSETFNGEAKKFPARGMFVIAENIESFSIGAIFAA